MRVSTLTRYPVKSMLGQPVEQAEITAAGLALDRRYGLLDATTGLVATAKHPRLWRRLLQYSAAAQDDRVQVTAPDGHVRDVDDPRLPSELAADLGREVTVAATRPQGAEVERPDPEDVLAQGVESEVAAPTLEISMGSAADTFVDYAPVHLITTPTLDRLGVDPVRYRPNLIIESDGQPFAETDWVGRELTVGEVVLRVVLPTPRCSVPTLEHGDRPRAPEALRPLLTDNRVDVPGFGVLPCAGVYAEVVRGGTVRRGDAVELG
ncbi:molybdenum cofactor biosynthesis protein [Actinomycetospora sp. NBRC 106375]|nr:MOSC N-terminal beta barrel domain-containing protein [Actinomycetospora sp. NBRC 106375]GLZ47768.1 molybdenum cofactor biosynthesis protein [Actinomycetospora sp. NBRC 106375]